MFTKTMRKSVKIVKKKKKKKVQKSQIWGTE